MQFDIERLKSALPTLAHVDRDGFEASRYLAKWMLISSMIGLVAGLGAVAFTHAIEIATEFFLGRLVDYVPPGPIGEGLPILGTIGRPWILPFVTALGGLISGIIVFSLAPEAEGHGTDAAIDAIHHHGGHLRARVAPIKLIASAITIGSGGSAGREGPAAQISATFGSMLSDRLHLSASDRRIAVSAGMGAGIGAIFRAPLGGAIMGAEILYLHDLEVEAIVPSLIASIVGYAVYGSFEGWLPIFGNQPGLALAHPVTLVYYALLGVLCGLVGLLYAASFYGIGGLFHKLRIPRAVKPAIGGFLVGLIALEVNGALHTGYGWVQISMTDQLMTLPLWIVLVLPFAKILATSLTVGSGGSGGIFGPGMVIGGMLGAAFWRVGHSALPQMTASPAPFVIVGMMALFGGIAHAPLAVMLMVAEMTGNLSLLAPAMVAVAVSTALVGNNTIYRSQIPSRADSPAHRLRLSFPLLSSLLVSDAMQQPLPAEVPQQSNELPTLAPDTPLPDALEMLSDAGASSGIVLVGDRPVGIMSVGDAMATYRRWLTQDARRIRDLDAPSRLYETTLDVHSALVGKTVQHAGLPQETLLISLLRDGQAIFPRASTIFQPGDRLTFVTTDASELALVAYLHGDQTSEAKRADT